MSRRGGLNEEVEREAVGLWMICLGVMRVEGLEGKRRLGKEEGEGLD